MAKRVNPNVLDAALNVLKTGITGTGPCNEQVVCSSEPTTYTEAHTTFMLATVAMASGDFTLANGATGGNTPRKITMGAKSGITIGTSGTATHVALTDTANSALLLVTTCTSQALVANGSNTVSIPSWTDEIGAPT
jgi:hypothetical protein